MQSLRAATYALPQTSHGSQDGSVLTWGDPEGGGDSRFVQMYLEGDLEDADVLKEDLGRRP